MNRNTTIVAAICALLAACASTPPPAAGKTEATAAAAPDERQATDDKGKPKPKWSGTTEAEVAAALDKKLEEAAKEYVVLRKNGQMMFCKKYKVIGSNIKTLHCITEEQLRTQVEDMERYRSDQRASGKCPHGPRGCQSN